MEEEIQSHFRMAVEERMDRGESAVEARYAVLREFGNVTLTKEVTRRMWAARWLDDLLRDVAYTGATLRRNAGFGLAVVVTLALGIGAASSVFSIVSAAILHTLPFRDPDRLVYFWSGDTRRGPLVDDRISPGEYLAWKNEAGSFDNVAAFDGAWFVLSGPVEPKRFHGDAISSDWFPVLGVEPVLGRNFLPEEQLPGKDSSVILSDRAWRTGFNADPNIAGRSVTLGDRAFIVVGVLPRSFSFEDRDIFVPIVVSHLPLRWDASNLHAVGRLKSGVTRAQAQTEAAGIARRLWTEDPAQYPSRGLRLVPVERAGVECCPTVGNAHRGLWIALGAVTLLMSLACANVANLLLIRGFNRRRELAIRRALGASSSRLVRQLFAETMVLFLAGGTLGFAAATWSRSLLMKLAASYVELPPVSFDGRVLLFTAAITISAAALFGLVPALCATRGLPAGTPKTGLRDLLVISQLTLAMGCSRASDSLPEATRTRCRFRSDLMAQICCSRALEPRESRSRAMCSTGSNGFLV